MSAGIADPEVRKKKLNAERLAAAEAGANAVFLAWFEMILLI